MRCDLSSLQAVCFLFPLVVQTGIKRWKGWNLTSAEIVKLVFRNLICGGFLSIWENKIDNCCYETDSPGLGVMCGPFTLVSVLYGKSILQIPRLSSWSKCHSTVIYMLIIWYTIAISTFERHEGVQKTFSIANYVLQILHVHQRKY